MLMWDNPNDQLGFKAYMDDKASDITGETKCPGWIPATESADLDARCATLAARLALEQQTVQRLARLNDDLQHCAERWQMRAFANAFWPFVCGAMTPGILWIAWQVAR